MSEDEEARAFAEAMRGARRLRDDQGKRVSAPPATEGRSPPRSRPASARPKPPPFIVATTGETVAARARDVRPRVLQELRAGMVPAEVSLDLHGRAREQAVAEVERFLAVARAAGRRLALVIHGRGLNSDPDGPVLRPAIWDWLASTASERAGVMAFATALPHEGGAGATLVLLRPPAAPPSADKGGGKPSRGAGASGLLGRGRRVI